MEQRQVILDLFLQSKGVCTDTRKDCEGKLFFALHGANFNGNQYALQALEKGAHYAVVDDIKLADDRRCIYVSDTLESLQSLARQYRRSFDIPVLTITGSNGKTTTKELIKHVLQKKYKVHATRGNFNNLIGLPLTILSAPRNTEFLLLEIGSNAKGEIKALSEIAEPDYGLITNVGEAHLEGFGDIQGVFVEKTSLYEHILVKDNGRIFVTGNDALLSEKYAGDEKSIVYQMDDGENHLSTTFGVTFQQFLPKIIGEFRTQDKIYSFQSTLFGRHNAQNISAAIAVGKSFLVDGALISEGIAEYCPENNRSQLIDTEAGTILLDAYNANISSMMAALDSFDDIAHKNKALFLGDMKEMGASEEIVHQSVLDKVASLKNITKAYFVGSCFKKLLPNDDRCYLHVDDLIQERKSEILEVLNTHHSLIKGSRSIALEKLVELL